MKSFRRLIFILALFATSNSAIACQCLTQSLNEKLERSEVALVGRVILPYTDLDAKGRAELLVTDSFKGDAKVGSRVALNPASGTSCAGFVPAGALVLVFGGHESDGTLWTTKCNIFGAEPLQIDDELHEPAAATVTFIEAQRALGPN